MLTSKLERWYQASNLQPSQVSMWAYPKFTSSLGSRHTSTYQTKKKIFAKDKHFTLLKIGENVCSQQVFQTSLIFASNTRAYPSGAFEIYSLTRKYKTRLRGFLRDKYSNLLLLSIGNEGKSFITFSLVVNVMRLFVEKNKRRVCPG